MFALFVSLALLGLSAIDPVGIALMPVLLMQKHPFKRSFIFLGGSFISLLVMGLLLAKVFGLAVLHFEKSHSWLLPSLETMAAIALLSIAGTLFWRIKKKQLSVEPPTRILKRLQLGNRHLFIAGGLLVAVQSVLDVVFVIAMVRIGQLNLADVTLTAAVATYAVAALIFQLGVVLAYRLSPTEQRTATLDKVHNLIGSYADEALLAVSFILGCLLLALAAGLTS